MIKDYKKLINILIKMNRIYNIYNNQFNKIHHIFNKYQI